MTTSRFQFHALTNELLLGTQNWITGEKLCATVFFGFSSKKPHVFSDLYVSGLEKIWSDVSEVALLRGAVPKPPFGKSPYEFLYANPNTLINDNPHIVDNTIRQASIGFGATNPADIRLWSRLIRKLRESLHKGMNLVNPDSKNHRALPSDRYSTGANEFFEAGGKLLAIAGSLQYEPS